MAQEGTAKAGKSIILFSDGTNNSSAKLFKTNVWRTYEATDLGPSPKAGTRLQIGYYDNGIGSESFKPLAILTGIFGIGLKRNVLTLYRYACRNHDAKADDCIYAFGFSRGAFTIRIVIALIASQGLVSYTDERDLLRKSEQAYRQMRRQALPRARPAAWLYRGVRWVKRGVDAGWQKLFRIQPYDSSGNYHPKIRYVGLWDTVAAYGGPIAELTRAIDNWIYPLSMPNYHLAVEVEVARHALSIDDERDSFHPLLWDEVHEKALEASGKVPPGRIQQVWFTGMHADVGGGYPDESLSYVPLSWILDGAQAAGLRLLADPLKRIDEMKNAYGPIHSSRSGAGAYYRYQPRRIAAWLQPVDPATYILRDPDVRDPVTRKPAGLLLGCKVHESVIARILSGTDDYAPITLPAAFDVVPPAIDGSMVGQAVRDQLAAAAPVRAQQQATLFDDVWRRRWLYFMTVAASVLLVAMPLPIAVRWLEPFNRDGVVIVGAGISIAGNFLPDFLRPWIRAWSDNPLSALMLIGLIAVLMSQSSRIERRLRDGTRAIWRGALTGTPAKLAETSWLRRFRESPPYQLGLQFFKWRLLPNIIGPAIILLGLVAATALWTQTRIMVEESNEKFCSGKPGALETGGVTYVDFHTNASCTVTGITLQKGHRYSIVFNVGTPWKDGKDRPVWPDGLIPDDDPSAPAIAQPHLPWPANAIGTTWRRSIMADWFRPVAWIGRDGTGEALLSQVYIKALKVDRWPGTSSYSGEFVAPGNGPLGLFVNDAVPPLMDAGAFYANNEGDACVTIIDKSVDLASRSPRADDKLPKICAALSASNRLLPLD